MTLRLTFIVAAIAVSGSAALAGPTVTPNASAITVVTPVPLDVQTTASTQAPVQQQAPVQAAPAPAPAVQSSFISNYVASFGR